MRISDWSSDVCSSDLIDVTEQVRMRRTELMLREAIDNLSDSFILYDSDQRVVLTNRRFHETLPFHPPQDEIVGRTMQELIEASVANGAIIDPRVRSDEHTSELQSLMRTSYAVFCLKKKKNK